MIDSCESGNETSGITNGSEFSDKLSDCHLLKDPAPRNQSFDIYLGQGYFVSVLYFTACNNTLSCLFVPFSGR